MHYWSQTLAVIEGIGTTALGLTILAVTLKPYIIDSFPLILLVLSTILTGYNVVVAIAEWILAMRADLQTEATYRMISRIVAVHMTKHGFLNLCGWILIVVYYDLYGGANPVFSLLGTDDSNVAFIVFRSVLLYQLLVCMHNVANAVGSVTEKEFGFILSRLRIKSSVSQHSAVQNYAAQRNANSPFRYA